jgi:5'-deoxynucleotidase YfbR-like HD superfamily hydrolase
VARRAGVGREPEARLVHDADKIDLFVQALVYEEQSGNAHLQEFWDVAPAFHYPPAQAIFDALQRQREADLRRQAIAGR